MITCSFIFLIGWLNSVMYHNNDVLTKQKSAILLYRSYIFCDRKSPQVIHGLTKIMILRLCVRFNRK